MNCEEDLISVIIPVYDQEKYVEKCIRSVLGQTWRKLELLVIDDGSSDNSGAILDRLAAEDERIRLVHRKNGGVSRARNRGIRMAKGRYITFVDGDDYLQPSYLERLHRCAVENKAQMVIAGLDYVDEKGMLQKSIVPDRYERFTGEEWTMRLSAAGAHLYEKDLWDRDHVRFTPGERGEDMPIALYFAATCDRIAVLADTGYCYVQHDQSAMHRFRGLKTWRLPYRSLETAIKAVRARGVVNSPEFHELFVLRILATCLFDLARGASREKKAELWRYIRRILHTYYPDYRQNRKVRLLSRVRVPFAQKAAVWLLVYMVG